MDKLRAMRVFVAIVDEGSLTAAAARLDLSLPAVVRLLAALEGDLGVRLLHRTTPRSSPSHEGREYYERSKRVLAEVEQADAAMSARRREPRGRLRVTAPVGYGRLRIAPLVAEYLARHPGVEVDLLLLDRVVDLVEEGIDVAVRIGELPDSSLVARRIGETRRVVCAAPAYLRREGTPRRPRDLAAHRSVQFLGLARGDEWAFGDDERERVSPRPVLRTNQLDVALDACVRGLGCARLLSYQVEALVAKGALVRVLEACEPPPVPIHLVYLQPRLVSATVAAFVELVSESHGDRPPGIRHREAGRARPARRGIPGRVRAR